MQGDGATVRIVGVGRYVLGDFEGGVDQPVPIEEYRARTARRPAEEAATFRTSAIAGCSLGQVRRWPCCPRAGPGRSVARVERMGDYDLLTCSAPRPTASTRRAAARAPRPSATRREAGRPAAAGSVRRVARGGRAVRRRGDGGVGKPDNPSTARRHRAEGRSATRGGRPARHGDEREAARVRGQNDGVRVPADCGNPPAGWKWRSLSSLARLETGSAQPACSEWGAAIFVAGAARHSRTRRPSRPETLEMTNGRVGDSSARLLPKDTVCLSRTASVGFVTVLGAPMATSQDFVNWVCGPDLYPWLLVNALIASRDGLATRFRGNPQDDLHAGGRTLLNCVFRNRRDTAPHRHHARRARRCAWRRACSCRGAAR